MRYALTIDAESTHLVCTLSLTSFPSPSALFDAESEGDEQQVVLGAPRYPQPEHLLPPVYLVEPCDDEDDAERMYACGEGYRFLGQWMLPDQTLGERVAVTMTRAARELWQHLVTQCPLQQAVAARVREGQARLRASLMPAGSTPLLTGAEQQQLDEGCRLLQQGAYSQALALLAHVPVGAIPLAHVLPCVLASDPHIRSWAVSLLARAGQQMPLEMVGTVLDCGDLESRVTAIGMLGQNGESLALTILLSARTHTRSSERIAWFEALVSLYQGAASSTSQLSAVEVADILMELLLPTSETCAPRVWARLQHLRSELGGVPFLEAQLIVLLGPALPPEQGKPEGA